MILLQLHGNVQCYYVHALYWGVSIEALAAFVRNKYNYSCYSCIEFVWIKGFEKSLRFQQNHELIPLAMTITFIESTSSITIGNCSSGVIVKSHDFLSYRGEDRDTTSHGIRFWNRRCETSEEDATRGVPPDQHGWAHKGAHLFAGLPILRKFL